MVSIKVIEFRAFWKYVENLGEFYWYKLQNVYPKNTNILTYRQTTMSTTGKWTLVGCYQLSINFVILSPREYSPGVCCIYFVLLWSSSIWNSSWVFHYLLWSCEFKDYRILIGSLAFNLYFFPFLCILSIGAWGLF